MWFSKQILFSTSRRRHCDALNLKSVASLRESTVRSRVARITSLRLRKAFSLIETVAALAILALVSSSVLVVVERCTAAMVDSELRMQAFEVARENMEKLLVLDSVGEMVEYGSSERYHDIEWQTVVEAFYEPVTARMWVRAMCSAEYTDTDNQLQTVELTHWLTNLTKKQVMEVIKQRQKEQQWLAEADQLVETIEEAAEYAGVDVEIIQEWADSGDMPVTEDGVYVKLYLDLYTEHDGQPPTEARLEAEEEYARLTGQTVMGGVVSTGPFRGKVPPRPGSEGPSGPTPQPGLAPSAGQDGGLPTITYQWWIENGFPPDWYDLFFPNASN